MRDRTPPWTPYVYDNNSHVIIIIIIIIIISKLDATCARLRQCPLFQARPSLYIHIRV